MTKERKQQQERICDNRCNLWEGGERANYFQEKDVRRERERQGVRERDREAQTSH